jgi:hypothetical protein
MNANLKEAKQNLKKIEQFCKSRPIPSVTDVTKFVEDENLHEYKEYALNIIGAVWAAEWVLHSKKINKSRM